MFSIATVASSTRMPTASARPPSVMMLIVSPSALSTMIDVRIDSGIETAMISVLRQLPRNSRIISAVRQAAISASRTTPSIARAHEQRLIGERLDLELRRQAGRDLRQHLLDARRRCRASRRCRSSSIVSSAARWPSTRTMLVCGGKPSRTCATSRM